jgi:peptidoglycan/xylan/chitin deacetylase (PgdA/CDA1 family)
MKAIMYHYVREFSSHIPKLIFLDIANFRKQLDYFGENFGYITLDEWKQYLVDGSGASEDGRVILTFDDGISDHYNYVYPELKSRGLWGIFYIQTLPYMSSTMVNVHKIHNLNGRFGDNIYDYLMSILSEDIYRYQAQNHKLTKLKKLLNYSVNPDILPNLLDKIANHFNFTFNLDDFYLSVDQIKEMSLNGMLIGAHTVSHTVMSKLSRKDQEFEIYNSFDYLDSVCNAKIYTYCHPFGGSSSYNEDTLDILEKYKARARLLFSFSRESREITDKDLEESRQSLPRFDCNEFPFGR